jgi:hypothetical protein
MKIGRAGASRKFKGRRILKKVWFSFVIKTIFKKKKLFLELEIIKYFMT